AIRETSTAFGVKRSFSGRRWTLREPSEVSVRALMQAGNISLGLAHILAGRGATPDALTDILAPSLKRLLPEPNTLKDMERAVARVVLAIRNGEKIAVYGDYDVDGSCSSALMANFLGAL